MFQTIFWGFQPISILLTHVKGVCIAVFVKIQEMKTFILLPYFLVWSKELIFWYTSICIHDCLPKNLKNIFDLNFFSNLKSNNSHKGGMSSDKRENFCRKYSCVCWLTIINKGGGAGTHFMLEGDIYLNSISIPLPFSPPPMRHVFKYIFN